MWQYITKEKICTVLALFALMRVVQKPSLTPFLMHLLVVKTFSFVTFLDRSEIICRILYFIDNSTDTFEGPQMLFTIPDLVPT